MNDDKKKEQGALLTKADEVQLRRRLLIEELECARREKRRGWLWHMGPTLAAIGASIAASVVVILFASQTVKGVAAYYESKVTAAIQERETVQTETNNLKSNIDKLNQLIENAKMRKESLLSEINFVEKFRQLKIELNKTNLEVIAAKKRKESLLKSLASIEDYNQQKFSENIGIDIQIQNDESSYSLNIDTFPKHAMVYAFTECDQNFIFPGEFPDPNSCQIFFSLECEDGFHQSSEREQVKGKAPCRSGPIQKMGNMDNIVWVLAELEGKRSYKYVHLTGF